MIRRALCLSFCVMAAAIIVRGQCPQFSITALSDYVQEGQPITYSVKAAGGPRNAQATYNWTVSDGTISSGQGTSVITVDTTGIGSFSVTATVVAGGYPRQCSTTTSWTVAVKRVETARKFDVYGAVDLEDE